MGWVLSYRPKCLQHRFLLVGAHAWVGGWSPFGCMPEVSDQHFPSMFLSLSFSLPSPLPKHEYIQSLKNIFVERINAGRDLVLQLFTQTST